MGILASSASRFGIFARLRRLRPLDFRDFDAVERRQVELAAGRFGAAEIMREQIALRPLFQLADGSDQEPHACSPLGQAAGQSDQITNRSMGRSADHIFSRL